MTFLPIPSGVDFKTRAGFEQLLPPESDLNDVQIVQRDLMLEQFENNEPYRWTDGHGGSIWNNWFRGWRMLKDKGSDGVYCSGLALEHWFRTHKDWLADLGETELDLTLAQMKVIKGFFFVYTNKERTDISRVAGGAKAIELVGEFLKERWQEAKNKSPDEYESFEDDICLEFSYHTDPFQAKFGDYVQLQSKTAQQVVNGSGGHAGIFVGLEKRRYKKRTLTAVRLFQANSTTDYGMKAGVNMGWYEVGRESNGFERIFHFGRMAPLD